MTRDEFLASLPPALREKAIEVENTFIETLNATEQRTQDLLDLADAKDWSDKDLWLTLAYLKGAHSYIRSHPPADGSEADAEVWIMFEQLGFETAKLKSERRQHEAALTEALARTPAAGRS